MKRVYDILWGLIFLVCMVGCALHFMPHSAKKDTPKPLKPSFSPDLTKESFRTKIVTVAKEQLGVRYRYGGMSPNGFDCSGFVGYVYRKAIGKKLPRRSLDISRYVKVYPLSKLKKGDLLFFDTSKKGHVNHCGIYLGDKKFIHSSSGKVYGVTISTLDKGFYKKTFRFGGKVPGLEEK